MRLSIVVPAILSLTFSPAITHADEVAAKTASDRADSLKIEGKLAESCAFRDLAAKEAPDFKRKWAVGICYEEAGKIATAWVFYDAALQFARAESSIHPTDDLLKEQARRAKIKVDDIATKVPKLQVVVTEKVPGLTVLRGTESVAEQYWSSPMPLDPGDYTFTATAPGYQKFEAKVTLKIADTTTITIPPLACEHPGADGKCGTSNVAPAPSTAPSSAPSSAPSATTSPSASPSVIPANPPPTAPSSHGIPTLTWVFGSAGVGLLATAGIFALVGKSSWSAAHNDGHCAGTTICNANDLSDEKTAMAFATATTFTFGAGILLLAGGVTVWAIGNHSESTPKTSLLVTPGGLSVVGSF